jgi:hypothetical protein
VVGELSDRVGEDLMIDDRLGYRRSRQIGKMNVQIAW